MIARVSAVQFAALFPSLPISFQDRYHVAFDSACVEYEINTLQRLAAFFAQVAHESAGLKYMEELGDVTYFRRLYEDRKDLGNTQPGDGARFHGRGPIQLTGRANYREFGMALKIKLEEYPELAATADVGAKIAARFWKTRGCNELADVGDFQGITRKINGGLNGFAGRMARWEKAKNIMSIP